jgi:cytochrome b6
MGQIGYWAVKIVTGVPDAIPVIGGPIVELLHWWCRCRSIL